MQTCDRVNQYVLDTAPVHQYGHGICNIPPNGFNCKTTFEQSNVIDVETALRNGQQSFGVAPVSTVNLNINAASVHSNVSDHFPEHNLRECKSMKTISKIQNDRWYEPTPRTISPPVLMDVNSTLGVDSRQLVKYAV